MKVAPMLLVLFCAIGNPAHGRNFFPELDEQVSAGEADYANPRYKNAEDQKLRAIGIQLQEKALTAEAKGQFEKAFEYWTHQSLLMPNFCIKTNAARCLNKLGRHQEALTMVQRVLDHEKGTDAFRLKIEIEIELWQFEEALKTCRAYKHYFELDGESPVLESTVLSAMGNKDKAVNSAREAYFYCARNGIPTDKAVEQMKILNVSLPGSIPYFKVDNEKVFANIASLLKCSRILTKREIRTLFAISSEYILDGSPLRSRKPLFFRDIVYQSFPLGPNAAPDCDSLRIDLNGDRCAITRADIESKVGLVEEIADFSQNSLLAKLKGVNNALVLNFDKPSGYLRSYQVQMPAQGRAVKPPPRQPLPPSLEKIRADLAQSRWRVAASRLMQNWDYYLGTKGGEDGYKRYLEAKRLLIQAYRGLELDDIARYIERAPCYFLSTDILKRCMYTDLPTSAEYASHKWTVNGNATDPQHGFYFVNVSTYGTVSFSTRSRYFKDLYELIGIKHPNAREISVLPCEWIDAETFQLR